jgi:dipeptidyl aminopeptidase/acylaminoacyl peptidase
MDKFSFSQASRLRMLFLSICKKTAALAICFFLASLLALPREEPPKMIPREVLFENPQKTSPKISCDGKFLAYLMPSTGVLNVWVRTIGRNDDRPVTSDSTQGISEYCWQPDNRHILYRQDKDGNGVRHLYQTDLESRSTRDLTPFEGVDVYLYQIYPAFPNQILVALNKRDRRLSDVYRLNLKTGELKLDTENPGDIVSWMGDNHMNIRLAGSFQPDGGQEIRVRHDVTSPWRILQKWGPEEFWGGAIDFSSDDKSVIMISSAGANTIRLVEVDIASGRTKVLAEDPHFNVGPPMMHPQTNALQAVPFLRPRLEWGISDKSLKKDFDTLRKVREGDFRVISRDASDRTWLVSYSTDDGPVYYYAYDRVSEVVSLMFADRPELERYRLAKMKSISFKARDGMTLYGYLTMPLGIKEKASTVLLVHGGPNGADRWGFNPLVQLLANRGYAVLQINFRGSTAHGKVYLNAGDKEWGGKMQDDLLDGRRWAIEQGFSHPNKIAIMGESYGGYATLCALAFTPDDFTCGVSISGPSNLITFSTKVQREGPIKFLFNRRVGDPQKDYDVLKLRSPLFQAHRIRSPLLIAHGANDTIVKIDESDQFVKKMRENNLPVEFLVFPDEGHGIEYWKPENSLRLMAAVDQFLAKHLGGRCELPSESEQWNRFQK